jgi:hypothetical protein
MAQGPVKTWTVEYIDDDGDSVVEQVQATDDRMAELLIEMSVSGLNPMAHDLSPQSPVDISTVSLPDEGTIGHSG